MQISGGYVDSGVAGVAESIDAQVARVAEEREHLAAALANEIARAETRLHQLREMRACVMQAIGDGEAEPGVTGDDVGRALQRAVNARWTR